jgi:DNA-binding NarL/FixJ family response regulator
MSTHPGTLRPLGAPGEAVRLLVVDAHEPTRLGLAFLLQRQPWVERCFLADGRQRAVELIARVRPAVAVVDISNLGPFVAPFIDALRAEHTPLRVLLTSRCAQSAAPARHAGAVGFLPHDAPGAVIVEAVRRAALGEAPVPEHEPDTTPLSPREREVLQLLATGATNREIAALLHLGPDSVKKHASSVYRKLGVRNRTEATQRAPALLAGA